MFKDLKNKLSKIQAYSEYKLDNCTNKPFWIWSEEEHIHEYKNKWQELFSIFQLRK